MESIPLDSKEADKFIMRIEDSQNRRAIRLLHFRAASTSGVCTGFERRFGYKDFRSTITVLAVVDLAFGHGT
jgi:hypothetical protein